MTIINLTDLVTIENDKPMTTSLKVAEVFGKQHKDVLRAIVNLNCTEDFTRRNFALSTYIDRTGRGLSMYRVTRDGFTILAMGFTGSRAVVFKERYIAAFNAMEAALRERHAPKPMTSMELLELQFKVLKEVSQKAEEAASEARAAAALGLVNVTHALDGLDDAVAAHCKHAVILKVGESPILDTPNRGLTIIPKSDHCKGSRTIRYETSAKGGNPNITIIPESDMYRLIIRSKLPSASVWKVALRWTHGSVRGLRTAPVVQEAMQVPESYKEAFIDPLLERGVLNFQETLYTHPQNGLCPALMMSAV